MAINNFPIGQILIGIDVIEDKDFSGNEYYLEKITLFFENKMIILSPISDTDEIEIMSKDYNNHGQKINTPFWGQSFVNKKLMTVWICDNDQGYQDQVIFALGYLKPSLAFVSEGSTIKVFKSEQIYRTILNNNLSENKVLVS